MSGAVSRGWPAWLARETDARPLALVRIIVGLSAVALAALVERDGLVRLTEEDIFLAQGASWLPTLTPGLVNVLLALWIAFGIALTIGLFARTAAAGVATTAAITIALDLQAFSNHVTLLIALSALLALANPGAVWSLDARLRGSTAKIPYWPVFLIKFQISTVYGYAALSKINGSFLSAEVLASRWEPVVGANPGAAVEAILIAVAVSTVLVEGFLAIALWSERLRRVALPVGLGLHVVIPATLGAVLIPFSLLMLSTYVLFPDWRPASRRVAWDPHSRFATRFVHAFARLDWFGVHVFEETVPPAPAGGRPPEPQPGDDGKSEVDGAITLVCDDKRHEGFDAIRLMLDQSPATFLFAPVLALRPVAGLGRRLYRRLASRELTRREPARA